MATIKDRFILGSVDSFINTDEEEYSQLVVITELALYDLEKYIESLDQNNIDEEKFKDIIAQVVIALDSLHNDLQICHRDLKPANILIFTEDKVKLSDFGFFKEIDKSRVSMSCCGTAMFSAPEVFGFIEGRVLPFVTDIYSLGITACWMVTRSAPTYNQITNKKIVFPDQFSKELKDFIYFCLVLKSEDRPNITQVIQQGYLTTNIRKY